MNILVFYNVKKCIIYQTFGIVKDSELQSYVGRLRDDFTDGKFHKITQ